MRQTSASVPSYGTNRPSSIFTNVGSKQLWSNANLAFYDGNNILFVVVTRVSPAIYYHSSFTSHILSLEFHQPDTRASDTCTRFKVDSAE